MFSNKLERPALALAVTAGLLAVAGPASAQGGDRVGAPSLKYETEVTDYVRPSTASDGHQGSPVSWVDKDLNQPDMGIREQPTQVNAPHGPPTPDESILVDLPPVQQRSPKPGPPSCRNSTRTPTPPCPRSTTRCWPGSTTSRTSSGRQSPLVSSKSVKAA